MSALTQEPEPWQDAMSESTPSHNRSGLCIPFHFLTHHKPWAGQQQHDVTVRDSPVKPTPAEGVGQPNLPLGDVTLRDKIVGKTQKVWFLSRCIWSCLRDTGHWKAVEQPRVAWKGGIEGVGWEGRN